LVGKLEMYTIIYNVAIRACLAKRAMTTRGQYQRRIVLIDAIMYSAVLSDCRKPTVKVQLQLHIGSMKLEKQTITYKAAVSDW